MTIQDYIVHTASRLYGVYGPLTTAGPFRISASRATAPRVSPTGVRPPVAALSRRFPLVTASSRGDTVPPITTSAPSSTWSLCPICNATATHTSAAIFCDRSARGCGAITPRCRGGCGEPRWKCRRVACLRKALGSYDAPRRAS